MNQTHDAQPVGCEIHRAMVSVTRSITAIGKDSRNETQKWKFRGIDSVLDGVHPLLADAGIYLRPRTSLVRNNLIEVVNRSGEKRREYDTVMAYEVDFVAGDGSYVTCGPVQVHALDSSDKSLNKCLSVALRYVLVQAFTIPVTDLDDPDSETITVSDESPKRQANLGTSLQAGLAAKQAKTREDVVEAKRLASTVKDETKGNVDRAISQAEDRVSEREKELKTLCSTSKTAILRARTVDEILRVESSMQAWFGELKQPTQDYFVNLVSERKLKLEESK